MSILFRKNPEDAQKVIFTAKQYQDLGDHITAISVLDYFISTTETNQIPILIIQIYLKSLIFNREYRAAFRLLDRFVNSPDYAISRSEIEKCGTSMQVTVILTVQYLELFNQIMNVYKSSFIENTLLNVDQFVITFQTLYNKIQSLFKEEPEFCDKNYEKSELFRRVVDRTIFVHNFVSAKSVSVLNKFYSKRSDKIESLLKQIQIIVKFNDVGTNKNLLSSLNLNSKGALMSLELLRTVQNALFEESTNETWQQQFQQAEALVESFIQSSWNSYSQIQQNERFKQSIWCQQLGYGDVGINLIFSLKNEIQIIKVLNITDVQLFTDHILQLMHKFKSEVQSNQIFDDFKQTITEHIKLLITIGDVCAQKQFSFLSFVIYCVVQKIYSLLDNLYHKQLNNFYMNGQVEFARDYYKLQVIQPLHDILSNELFISNMNFAYLFDTSLMPLFNLFEEHFDPLDSLFDFKNENFSPQNREFEYQYQIQKLRQSAHLDDNLQQFRPIVAIRISSIFTQLAQNLLLKRDLSQAIGYARIAVKIWPYENAYFLMIKAYGQLNDGNAASIIAQECTQYHPENDRAKLFSGSDVVVTSI